MDSKKGCCVYITTNVSHSVLYTGVTSDIVRRVFYHKSKTYPNSFTAKYDCAKLVYFAFYPTIEEAIAAEKVIKGGDREHKIQIINALNPQWEELYDDLTKD